MIQIICKKIATICSVLIAVTLICLSQTSPCFAVEISTPQLGPTNPQELELFIDDYFAKEMSKQHVPGAVFALVKDGKIFFSKGYGYADLENKIPVDPDKTLFRVGSISKLFTATAVMQLAEQGKLNLNDDVNKYLKRFQIPNTYPKPIAFTNLLTHTDGFDAGWGIGAFARKASQMIPLGDFIAKRLPPRILPPGEVFLYSDVGMNLAGYLVEEISGMPFAEYVDKNILQPLNMRRTSFVQPLPPQLASDFAVGYKYKDGTYRRRPFAYSNTVPGNALMATATDIAHFAIAHLQKGRYENARILKEATATEMHRRQFAQYPGMVGSTYGFFQRVLNKQRTISHGGRHAGYTSELYLLPDRNLGFFISCNNNPTRLADKLVDKFLDRYYPPDKKIKPIPPGIKSSQAHLQNLSGNYRYVHYPHHTIEKLAAIFGEAAELRTFAGQDGTLSLWVPEFKSVEIQPLLFRFLYSNNLMGFRQEDGRRITHMFLGHSVYDSLEKLTWFETNDFQLKLAIFCTLIFGFTCIIAVARNLQKPTFPRSKIASLAMFLAVLISALNLVFLIGTGLVLSQADFWELFFGLPGIFRLLLLIPPISTSLTPGLIVFAFLTWKDRASLIWKVYYSLIALAGCGFVSIFINWNLYYH
ncbi:serine hydrolase [Microcoleus sp. CAWBG58]|uniref:serine hydrolase domain-containing protein n=1 Tax=Microcoleus sp. CAWBG58 TaxID=2841651 RepID=UPI0025DA7EAD|nr:serine hydrolase domain-containing protein [Microcoleus sp. CAWBG58]